jgi:hypothetical protein
MKLRWFEKNLQPAEVYRIKDMMLDEVMSIRYIKLKLLLITTKLSQYEPTGNENSGPLCSKDDWAAELLGLRLDGSATVCGLQQGVEMEFQTYTMDRMLSVTPLAYWQVSN